MKITINKMFTAVCLFFVLLFTSCPLQNGENPEYQPHLSEQQKCDRELGRVQLEVPKKSTITAGELKQEDIIHSGYDTSYAIKFETIKANSDAQNAAITFFLKKDGLISKQRTVTITGFKEKNSAPTEQEVINATADTVTISVVDKETLFADELAANKDKITASGVNSPYTINYTVIKGDIVKREAEITFQLENGTLHSKTRTVTITGFKEKVPVPDTIDITEKQLLKLFDLTETKIPASAAAKKIAEAQGTTIEDFTFEEAQAVVYDDKTGTFTVKVKGIKNGKTFGKTIAVTGFANPYTLIFPSFNEVELDFSNAIENNTRLDAFIVQANTDITTVLKKLSFSDNNTGSLVFGSYEYYRLAATLEKTGDEIKIKPKYTVRYLKKDADEQQTITEEDYSPIFSRLKDKLIKPYFSKNDVFKYLLGKTNDTFLNVYPDKFASMYYASAKHFNSTPDGLLNDMIIQGIINRYKNDGGHLKMDIETSVYNPKEDSIEADDYTGSLEILYCIAESEQITAMLRGEDMPSPIVAIKKAKRTGFKKVTKENAGTLFNFRIRLTVNAHAESKWKQKICIQHPLLRPEYDSNSNETIYKVYDPFKKGTTYYTVTVNEKKPEEVFAFENSTFFSKCADGTDIFIERISLNKEQGSDTLKIYIQFTGEGDSILIEKQPE